MVPTVSIIVPAYNAAQWIAQSIQSILDQDYLDIEVIVVNDGSTDNSSGAIPRGDDRLFISHHLHRGVSAARNTGLDLATGEFVMFVDADDYLESHAIGAMVKVIDGVDLVVGSFRKFGTFEMTVEHSSETLDVKEVAQIAMSNLREPRHYQILSGCWAKLFRRALIGRFPDLSTAEDMALNFDYLMRCKKVRFISDIVYHNRKRAESLTTTFDGGNKSGLFGFLEALKYVERFLQPFYSKEQIDSAIDNSKLYHAILYFMRICDHTGEPMNDVFKRLYP